jgi:hypothetical protein
MVLRSGGHDGRAEGAIYRGLGTVLGHLGLPQVHAKLFGCMTVFSPNVIYAWTCGRRANRAMSIYRQFAIS